jgi:hypothetical protein
VEENLEVVDYIFSFLGSLVSDCDALVKRRDEISRMSGDEALETIYQSRYAR